MASAKDKKAASEEIIEKVKSKLQGWKMKTLSQASRATLITSVANLIPSYQAASLLLPKHVCSKLDALNRNCWWGKKEDNKLGCCLKS